MFVTFSNGNNPILVRLLKYKKGYELTLAFKKHGCTEREALDLSITFYKMSLQKKRRHFYKNFF